MKSGSSGPQLRSTPSKVGCLKEEKLEGKKDKIGRQLNQKKIDVSRIEKEMDILLEDLMERRTYIHV